MPDPIVEKELAHDSKDGTIARLALGQKKWRTQATKLVEERNTARAEATQLKADLVEAQKHAGAAAELAALKVTVKNNLHRGAFDKLAKEAGAKDKALDDLWERSGYKADGDVPDAKAMTKAIEAQREARDYLFEEAGTEADPAAGGPDTPPEPEQLEPARPGPGRGQGGTKRSSGSQTQITDAQMRDPAWCFANAGKLAAAATAAADLPTSQVGAKLTIV
jgi:hypothetical protein